jgi:hypothetical protein
LQIIENLKKYDLKNVKCVMHYKRLILSKRTISIMVATSFSLMLFLFFSNAYAQVIPNQNECFGPADEPIPCNPPHTYNPPKLCPGPADEPIPCNPPHTYNPPKLCQGPTNKPIPCNSIPTM